MYESYEQLIKKYAAILRTVCIVLAVLAFAALLGAGYIFGIGVAFGDVECPSVVYGDKPEPSLSASVPTKFEYRLADDKDAAFTSEVPVNAGSYVVRAYTVSLIGFKRYASETKFEIRPAKLTVKVPKKEDYCPVEEIRIDPSECTVSGLQYGDTAGEPELQYDYAGQTATVRVVSIPVTHRDGSNAMDCYAYSFENGLVSDIRVPLYVTAGSKTVRYDGDPTVVVTEESYKLSGKLMPGHTGHFACVGEQRGIGSSSNVINLNSLYITDGDDKDVTYMYKIQCGDGVLTFAQRKIVVTSDSASKEYDGLPLVQHSCKIGGEGLAEGDELKVDYPSYIIYPGKVSNELENLRIVSRKFGDVTDYYDITIKLGTLKITSEEEKYEAPDDDEFNMDMNSNPFEGMADGTAEDGPTIFEYYGVVTGRTYFKEAAYGVYTGRGFKKTPGEDEYGNYGNYLTGNSLKSAGKGPRRMYIRNYNLNGRVYPYHMADDMKKPLESEGFRYDYNYEIYQLPEDFSGVYSDEEREYADFVHKNYMDVPDDVAEVLRELGESAGIDPNSETLVEDIAEYISTAATYNLRFAPYPDDEDMVIYFLTGSKEGICQHYAAAATLMYRIYGIPARFVVGLAPEGFRSTWNPVLPKDGHAWTEVYIDGTGWVPVEVTGSSSDFDGYGGGGMFGYISVDYEDIKDQANLIVVSFNYYEKEYDGLPVLNIEPGGEFIQGSVEPNEAVICQGEIMTAPEYVGEYIFYGDAIVVRDDGTDVTDNYFITIYQVPTIKIKPRSIEITTYGMEGAEQDGRLESSGWFLSKGTLASGDRIELTLDASQYKIGTTANTPRYIHVINENGEDITDCYNISINSGSLVVK
ncbi:MAG: transglutaminase domain-containing protein [Lachnospiraceae bacterium]|nr:transglutaminase domain-containing protein [Lachnospiraceae bacterium]